MFRTCSPRHHFHWAETEQGAAEIILHKMHYGWKCSFVQKPKETKITRVVTVFCWEEAYLSNGIHLTLTTNCWMFSREDWTTEADECCWNQLLHYFFSDLFVSENGVQFLTLLFLSKIDNWRYYQLSRKFSHCLSQKMYSFWPGYFCQK